MRLQGKVAAITGAGSGIGRAIALGFAKEGAAVVAGDLAGDAAEATSRSIADAGGRATAVQVNVTSAADATRLVETAVREFGRLDILVSCAGLLGRADFLELSEAEWDRVVDVNLKGTFLCGQAAARQMVAQGGGAIINISSVSAVIAHAQQVHYAASKGGVKLLTAGMAVALGPRGIRVNALGPGTTETPMTQPYYGGDADERARRLARIPMGRLAEPEDMVGPAIFLASDEARYVTGATLYVHGGRLVMA